MKIFHTPLDEVDLDWTPPTGLLVLVLTAYYEHSFVALWQAIMNMTIPFCFLRDRHLSFTPCLPTGMPELSMTDSALEDCCC